MTEDTEEKFEKVVKPPAGEEPLKKVRREDEKKDKLKKRKKGEGE